VSDRGESAFQEISAVPQDFAVPAGVVLMAVLITAATDLWKFKVHNVLTLPLLAGGLIYHGVVEGQAGLATSSLGMLFGFGALFGFYVLGGMGGGDVKLFAAVGAWLGMPFTFYAFLATSLAAGVYSLCVIVFYRTTGDTWSNLRILWFRFQTVGRYLGSDDRVESAVGLADRRGRLIPFALMIAVGTVVTVLLVLSGRLP
jgi:prepilin peptidase CpaA